MIRRIWLIRHGKTRGNLESRYVGTVDESLDERGAEALYDLKKKVIYPYAKTVFVSYMKRCRETASILFPDAAQIVVPGLHECDFGDFEYKSYNDLNGYPDYQDWIDSGGTAGFPGGESMEEFQERVCHGFEQVIDTDVLPGNLYKDKQLEDIVFVCHGGSIMAILDKYSSPHRDYFDWQAANGLGFTACLDEDAWRSGEQFLTDIKAIDPVNGQPSTEQH